MKLHVIELFNPFYFASDSRNFEIKSFHPLSPKFIEKNKGDSINNQS